MNENDFVPPTPEWIKQNAESGYCPKGSGKIRYINRDPLRIDRLLRKNLIEPHQHTAALHFYTLYIAAMCHGMRSPMGNLEQRSGGNIELTMLNRLTAEEKYRWIEVRLKPLDGAFIYAVVCEEEGIREAAARLGIKRDESTGVLRAALDVLGELIDQMRLEAEALLEQRNKELAGAVKKPEYRGAMVSWSQPQDATNWEAV